MSGTAFFEMDLYVRRACGLCCAAAETHLHRALGRLGTLPVRVRVLDVADDDSRCRALAQGVVVTPTLLVRTHHGRPALITLELADEDQLTARLGEETWGGRRRPAAPAVVVAGGAP